MMGKKLSGVGSMLASQAKHIPATEGSHAVPMALEDGPGKHTSIVPVQTRWNQ